MRRSDAHSWVEIWDGSGQWITFDPTPTSVARGSSTPDALKWAKEYLDFLDLRWSEAFTSYSIQDQVEALRSLTRPRLEATLSARRLLEVGGLLIGASVLALLIGASRRIKPHRVRGSASKCLSLYEELFAFYVARGASLDEAMTHQELLERVRRMGYPGHPLAAEICALYEETRFGGAPEDAAELDRLRRALTELGSDLAKNAADSAEWKDDLS